MRQRLVAYYREGEIPSGELRQKIESLSEDVQAVQQDEPVVSRRDYEMARKGVQAGEEVYTEVEKTV